MTKDYRLTHSGLARRAGWPASSGHTKALDPDGKDSSLTSLSLLRAGPHVSLSLLRAGSSRRWRSSGQALRSE
jgi:hypothetical protein